MANGKGEMVKMNFKPEVKITMVNGEWQLVNLPFAIQDSNGPRPGEW